ncbi:phage tail repeat-like family, partial [Trichomonas vaginalis G3]|uniref:phage tail repeat-like family n=1 Tax=Trichomonas vaginalis (strain ATCC PRA-98 / G3) TaxID=412133 RepID=UPI0021E59570
MSELVNAARTLGETGNFVDGFKRLVSNVLTNTKKLFRYTVHNGRIFEQIATNPPVMAALMMVRDIKPRSGEGEEHEQQDTGRVIRDIKNVYPEVIDLFRGVNDSISKHSITLDEENKLTDYIFVIIAELMKRINEKGIGDIINVSDVMMKRNFDSLFTEPKTEYSLYDVITELMKKINDNKSSGGRVELEMNDVNEKTAEKADKNELLVLSDKVKNHVHYMTSDEQIITDYHEYLTQTDEEVKTEDPNERRYKYIRAKGYNISCTVQYDTGKAQETFSYNDEIYASYFSVNGVLVEPKFTLRVKAKITFEDAIKSKADKVELEAMNKVLRSHKHNISDINELQATLDSKADKNHTHKSFTTVRADDIILNYDLGSSAPLENPSTSVKDTLNNLDNRCMNIEGHARNFEAYELPAMLDKKADKTELQTLKTEILQTLYPVGSLYTSMNSTNPASVLGFGAWEQIVDRFLYCANSSKETGGSKTISGENLPAHSHYIDLSTSQAGWHKHRYWDWSGMTKGKGYDVKDDVKFAINCYWSDTQGEGNHTHFVSGYTQTTGQSKEYMPPLMTVFA